MSGQTYYVRVGDQVHGPADMNQLARAAAEGRVRADHQVSTDRQHWFAAHVLGLPFDAGLAPPQSAVLRPIDELAHDGAAGAPAEDETPFAFGDARGILTSCVLLLCLFFPWGPGPKGDGVTMWWDFFGADGMRVDGSLKSLLIISLLIGVATLVVSLATRGIPRGAAFLGMSLVLSVSLATVASAGLKGSDAPRGIQSMMTAGVMLQLMQLTALSALWWQRFRPSRLSPRILSCVAGGLSIVLLAALTIESVGRGADSNSRLADARGSNGSATASVIFSLIAAGTLAGSVLAVVSIIPRYIGGLNAAGRSVILVTQALAFASPIIVLLISMEAKPTLMSPGSEFNGWLFLIVLRFTLIFVSAAILFGSGLLELLVSLTPPRRAPRAAG